MLDLKSISKHPIARMDDNTHVNNSSLVGRDARDRGTDCATTLR